jgi:starch phosphorylase
LGLPFVGVGLLYRQGYFKQTIDGQGEQVAHYRPTSFADLPVQPARDEAGEEVRITVPMGRRSVEARVWQARVGHIRLYLLDTDLPANSENDRAITYQLYGGDIHTRIQQEIMLGIGGVRALRALNLQPTVWHINEGHSAFQIIERIRNRVQAGLDFDSALELVASRTVFTTHTPVPAGHDIFSHELMLEYLQQYLREMQVDEERFLSLGSYPGGSGEFNQTALALRGSRFHNGVSRIHGQKASQMEGYVWPQIPASENPIGYVTNGVHVPTFLAREWTNLLDLQFGGGWRNELVNPVYWDRQIESIPDYTFWSLRRSLKAKLLAEAYGRVVRQLRRNGCSESELQRLTRHLDPTETDVLTIGFARRFATYKRATLLFSSPQRLARLMNDPQRPIIILFAGKAHPKDRPGQQLIRKVHEYARQPEFQGKIILIEDYDLSLARSLVTGVDVWLNNPEYPLEASGTSGQKAAINGVINLSITDGWWGEGYNGENGWAITPHGPQFDPGFRDAEEADELLDLLENHVVPLYYQRNGHGYSEGWVNKSKASMKSIMPRFNAQRMLMDYLQAYYGPASRQGHTLAEGAGAGARELAAWKRRVERSWPKVAIRRTDASERAILYGQSLPIEVAVRLDGLLPEDVVVECLLGIETEQGAAETGAFTPRRALPLEPTGRNEQGEYLFRLDLPSIFPGLQFYKLRVYPFHRLLSHRFEMGYMLWV